MNQIEFRKATVADIPQLVVMREMQLRDEGLACDYDIKQDLFTYFTDTMTDGTFIAWLALCGDVVVGTSGVIFYRLPPHYNNPTGHIAHISNMHTLASRRRQGIATTLLNKVIEEARARGCIMVRLNSSKEGRALYIRFGFYEKNNLFEFML